MKEKLFTTIKNYQQKSVSFSEVIIVSMYLTIISLSLRNNNLFLEELILCGTIIGLALLNDKTTPRIKQ